MKIDISRFIKPKHAPTSLPTQSLKHRFSIGLDFGTAFTKVIIRDVNNLNCELFIPNSEFTSHQDTNILPFLTPSVIYYGNDESGDDWFCRKEWEGYTELPFLKLALRESQVAPNGSPDVMTPFHKAAKQTNYEPSRIVRDATIFHLTGVLQEVANHLIEKYPNLAFEVFVTMAVPVEHINDTATSSAFLDCLKTAYSLVNWDNTENSLLETPLTELASKIDNTDTCLGDSSCFLYPEVSANMVAYTMNRASREGIFQLVDVGAGTVDISFFSFIRNSGDLGLNNFVGKIDFCGSSQIERLAIREIPEDERCLHTLRGIKEGYIEGDVIQKKAIKNAKRRLLDEVSQLAHVSRLSMRKKMPTVSQLNESLLILVGGGSSPNPYHKGIMNDWKKTQHPDLEPTAIAPPPDLKLNDDDWFSRLTVAYGLSIEPVNRPSVTTPRDHDHIALDNRVKKLQKVAYAPSKDDC